MQMFHSALSKFHKVQARPAGWLLWRTFLPSSSSVSALLLPCKRGRHSDLLFPVACWKYLPPHKPWRDKWKRGQSSSFFSLYVGMTVIINLTAAEVNTITSWLRMCLKGQFSIPIPSQRGRRKKACCIHVLISLWGESPYQLNSIKWQTLVNKIGLMILMTQLK